LAFHQDGPRYQKDFRDMELGRLDHVNVRTANLENMVSWYGRMLGMKSGDRPNFPFPGAWMYVGDQAVVHLIGVAGEAGAGSEVPLKLEHFAFQATGFTDMVARLDAAGERYHVNAVPGAPIVQINIWDPDGNHIHVDFASSEVPEKYIKTR
jgi:catechol 2,3-dioxygenase-like lactoylglutathione lyase family enzyme